MEYGYLSKEHRSGRKWMRELEYSHEPNLVRLCYLGRAGHFMEDATAISRSSAAQDLLGRPPQELIDMVITRLEPKDCRLTRFQTWKGLSNLEQI